VASACCFCWRCPSRWRAWFALDGCGHGPRWQRLWLLLTLRRRGLERRQVRVLGVGPSHQALIDLQPDRWRKLFDCRSTPCAVYVPR